MASGDQNPESEKRREKAFERMLAEALSRDAREDCPDAETLAAFYERAIAPAEVTRWRAHFAECSRCQQTLAAMAASDPNPLADAEVERLGELIAGAAPSRSASKVKRAETSSAPTTAVRWPWYFDPRRLVPLAAAAVFAGAIWLAVRSPYVTQPAQQSAAESSANQTFVAENNAPSMPEAAPPSTAHTSGAGPVSRAVAPPALASALPPPPPAAPRTATNTAAPAAAQQTTAANAQLQQAPAAAADSMQASAPPEEAHDTSVAEARTSGAGASASGGAASGIAGGTISGVMSRPAAKSLRMEAAPASLVTAKNNPQIVWRFGLGGRIERSTDGGSTWTAQSSPVQTDMLAGSAPSETVCWLVGRGGAIVRTVDGETWDVVPSPKQAEQNAEPPDWTFVDAGDASSAIVGDASGRRFSTADGGKTWQPQ